MAFRLLIIAFRNMRRQSRRTILTALTFAVAVFMYTVLVAVPWSMDRIADGASKGLRLVVTERNNNRLPARYCDQIKKMPHVLGCAPEMLFLTHGDEVTEVSQLHKDSDRGKLSGS